MVSAKEQTGSGFCFAVLEDGEFGFNTVAAIADGQFSMGDGSDDQSFLRRLPPGFKNCAEWCYEYKAGSAEEGRQALLAVGFVEMKDPWS